jgi:hypothetical protein
MRKVEEASVRYIGYLSPETKDEIEFEILGLELAIACANQRISLLRQGLKIAEMKENDADKKE